MGAPRWTETVKPRRLAQTNQTIALKSQQSACHIKSRNASVVTVIWWERERSLNCLQSVIMCNVTSVGKEVDKSVTHPRKLKARYC